MEHYQKYTLVGLLLVGLAMIGCSKEAVDPDVSFAVDKTTVRVGEPVTFQIGVGAEKTVVFTGDAGKEYKRSQMALVNEDSISRKNYRLLDPIFRQYRNDFVLTKEIPANLTPSGLTLARRDSFLLVNITQPGPTNELVIKNLDTGLQGNAVANANNLVLQMGFSNVDPAKAVRIGVQMKMSGIYTDAKWGANYKIYSNPFAVNTVQNITINLNTMVELWKTNTKLPVGKIDELKITFGDGPVANQYTGEIKVQSITVGVDVLQPFDVGVLVPYPGKGKMAQYAYTYSKPGTYTATLLTTNIGAKQYTGDGYISDRASTINLSEYNIKHDRKEVVITVTP